MKAENLQFHPPLTFIFVIAQAVRNGICNHAGVRRGGGGGEGGGGLQKKKKKKKGGKKKKNKQKLF